MKRTTVAALAMLGAACSGSTASTSSTAPTSENGICGEAIALAADLRSDVEDLDKAITDADQRLERLTGTGDPGRRNQVWTERDSLIEKGRDAYERLALVVEQNPDCFSVEDRAGAEQMLRQLDRAR